MHYRQALLSYQQALVNFKPSKRQKIIVSTLIFVLGFLAVSQTENVIFHRYYLIVGLGVVTYLLSLWALWEGMTKQKALVLLTLPTFFSLGAVSFYFTFREVRWVTRLPLTLVLGFIFYGLLLTQNVFNVAAARTIPLYRAASTSSFVFTLITAFFLYAVTLTLNLPFYWNFLIVFAVSFLLIWQCLWSIEMESIAGPLLVYSFILSLINGELALALSFWPVGPTVWSLFLSTSLYIFLGVLTEFLKDKLSGRVVWEYAGVGVIVILFAFLSTSWVG